MSDQRLTIYELPEFWREKVRGLKAENRNLRQRLKNPQMLEDLPNDWQKRIRDIRRESARYRSELRQAEAEVARLQAQLEARRSEAGK